VRARRILPLAALEFRLLLRNGENLLVTLGLPVGALVFFSLVEVLPTPGDRAVDFLVPGVLALSVMGSAMVSLGISTGFERSYLVIKRLGATPLRRSELVVGKALATLVVLLVQVVVVGGIGLTLGWRPAPVWWATIAALLLGALAFAGIGMALAGRLRALGTLALINALFVMLVPFSGLVFPLTSMPEPVAQAVQLLPSTALGETLRGALSPSGPDVAALVVLAVWAVVMPLVAARLFRWE
jgi:ABC-2 type transport system permease protein